MNFKGIRRNSARTVCSRAGIENRPHPHPRPSRAAASQSVRSDTLAPSESGAHFSYPQRFRRDPNIIHSLPQRLGDTRGVLGGLNLTARLDAAHRPIPSALRERLGGGRCFRLLHRPRGPRKRRSPTDPMRGLRSELARARKCREGVIKSTQSPPG